MKLVDTVDSKSAGSNPLSVQVRSPVYFQVFMPFFLVTPELYKIRDEFLDKIRCSASYSFPPSEEFPLSSLYQDKGMMFSILLAHTQTGEKKVLLGSSGMKNIPGYVNPCYSKNRMDEVLEKWDNAIKESKSDEERREMSTMALKEINSLFQFSTLYKDKFSLLDVESAKGGSGTCAGVKTINTLIRKGYEIDAFAEFFVGRENENYKEGLFYPPCRERCEEIIRKMLLLDYIYLDESIAVVNKEPGLLSVPGRGEDKKDSVSLRFRLLFPSAPENPACHRLDMDTSGIMILARDKDALRKLSMDFEERNVHKVYEALLEGKLEEKEGIIDRKMRLDVDNRPYQILDDVDGKDANTHFRLIGYGKINGKLYSRVEFRPLTGRTHQIRVHASKCLKHPIIGDRLYGKREEGERLFLHAKEITFTHPKKNEPVTFTSPTPF